MSLHADIVSTRTTVPHLPSLRVQLQAAFGPLANIVMRDPQNYRVKKATDWTTGQLTAVTNAINAAAPVTPQLIALEYVDSLPIWEKEWKRLEVEEFNRLRAALTALGAPNLPQLEIADILATWRLRVASST